MRFLLGIGYVGLFFGFFNPVFLLFPLFTLVPYYIYKFILNVKKKRYFNSEGFLEHKRKIDFTIKEYNEISNYVRIIPNNNVFVHKETSGEHSHLAKFENTSKHNYIRDRNKKDLKASNVHQASLQIVRKASEEPIKYLCKYFNIKPTEENIEQLEGIGENISRMENTFRNLELRQKEITNDFNPPKFMLKYFHKELMEQIGMDLPKIGAVYSQYIFEYISAGGNSSQRTVIDFDAETVESTTKYISDGIKYNKSAKKQRSLMTNKLRTQIKERDDYTCLMCAVSTDEHPLILLEIDHIFPVSKGGLSTEDNLQTLCWKCNRTKSDKVL